MCVLNRTVKKNVIVVYSSEQFSAAQNVWVENKDLKIEITVEVI